jgi:hypothetical protein
MNIACGALEVNKGSRGEIHDFRMLLWTVLSPQPTLPMFHNNQSSVRHGGRPPSNNLGLMPSAIVFLIQQPQYDKGQYEDT